MTARTETAAPRFPPDRRRERPSAWRRIARISDQALPIVGVVVIFAGVAFLHARWMQICAALVGLLLVEAGIWNLASVVGIRERRYQKLRNEVDRFLSLVRSLNGTARSAVEHPAAAREAVDAVLARMHASVDRMGAVAADEDRSGVDPHSSA